MREMPSIGGRVARRGEPPVRNERRRGRQRRRGGGPGQLARRDAEIAGADDNLTCALVVREAERYVGGRIDRVLKPVD